MYQGNRIFICFIYAFIYASATACTASGNDIDRVEQGQSTTPGADATNGNLSSHSVYLPAILNSPDITIAADTVPTIAQVFGSGQAAQNPSSTDGLCLEPMSSGGLSSAASPNQVCQPGSGYGVKGNQHNVSYIPSAEPKAYRATDTSIWDITALHKNVSVAAPVPKGLKDAFDNHRIPTLRKPSGTFDPSKMRPIGVVQKPYLTIPAPVAAASSASVSGTPIDSMSDEEYAERLAEALRKLANDAANQGRSPWDAMPSIPLPAFWPFYTAEGVDEPGWFKTVTQCGEVYGSIPVSETVRIMPFFGYGIKGDVLLMVAVTSVSVFNPAGPPISYPDGPPAGQVHNCLNADLNNPQAKNYTWIKLKKVREASAPTVVKEALQPVNDLVAQSPYSISIYPELAKPNIPAASPEPLTNSGGDWFNQLPDWVVPAWGVSALGGISVLARGAAEKAAAAATGVGRLSAGSFMFFIYGDLVDCVLTVHNIGGIDKQIQFCEQYTEPQ